MIIVDGIPLDPSIAGARFSCDLARCKGACCTLEGGRGAPLLDEEKALVERALPVVRPMLPERTLAVIDRRGVVEGVPGSYATACVDDRDCVFVYYEGDVAKCSIEAAWLRGEYPWRKPVSCHLFPLRAGADGGPVRYEAIPECSAGRERGRADGVALHEFLRDAIVRRFGEGWYDRVDAAIGDATREAEPGPAAPRPPRGGEGNRC